MLYIYILHVTFIVIIKLALVCTYQIVYTELLLSNCHITLSPLPKPCYPISVLYIIILCAIKHKKMVSRDVLFITKIHLIEFVEYL